MAGGLKRVLGARSPKSRYLQNWSLPGALRRESISRSLLASGVAFPGL